MLSLLTPQQSEKVGGPIGSLREAKTVASYPNYDAAYLAKRLGATNPNSLLTNRYDTAGAGLGNLVDELVYKQNAVKGYEAEAEECLKREFKDWLEGKHIDNVVPHTHSNTAGGAVRRDMNGKQVDNWVPTWWGPNQLTYLPGVREYLREQAIRADKNSLDLNVLAHLGPQNLEEAWAYFKHWVKGRPVGPEVCLNKPAIHSDDTMLPNRAGPIHMQHDTKLHPDRPYNPNTAYNSLPAWPVGGGGGGGGGFGFGLGGPPPRAPPPSDDDSDDDDDGFGALVPAAKNVTPEGMYRGRAEGGRDYFFSPSRLRWADSEEEFVPYQGPQPYEWERVQAAIDRADVEVTTADVEGIIRRNERALASLEESPMLATPMKLEGSPGSRNDSAIVPSRSRAGRSFTESPEVVDLTLSRLRRGATTSPNRVPVRRSLSNPRLTGEGELSPQGSRFPVNRIPTPDPTEPFAPPPPNSPFSLAPVSSPGLGLSLIVDDPRNVAPALLAKRADEAKTRRTYEQQRAIRENWRRRVSVPREPNLVA
jgi:hypothetical protein